MQDIPIDRLGQYPILQFAAAVLILGGFAFAIWKATKGSGNGQPYKSSGQQVQWFFDGPLIQALNIIREINIQNDRIIEQNEEAIREHRESFNVLRDIKNILEIISRTRKF